MVVIKNVIFVLKRNTNSIKVSLLFQNYKRGINFDKSIAWLTPLTNLCKHVTYSFSNIFYQ